MRRRNFLKKTENNGISQNKGGLDRLICRTIAAAVPGVTSENIDGMSGSNKASVQRLTGVKPVIGKPPGLDDKRAYRMIKQVGNYGEIYASTFGSKSKKGLSRGLNALWKDGGLLYALPLR